MRKNFRRRDSYRRLIPGRLQKRTRIPVQFAGSIRQTRSDDVFPLTNQILPPIPDPRSISVRVDLRRVSSSDAGTSISVTGRNTANLFQPTSDRQWGSGDARPRGVQRGRRRRRSPSDVPICERHPGSKQRNRISCFTSHLRRGVTSTRGCSCCRG